MTSVSAGCGMISAASRASAMMVQRSSPGSIRGIPDSAVYVTALDFISASLRLGCRYSRDANAGADHPVPPIDADEYRGQCLRGDGVGQCAAVDTARAGGIGQLDDALARGFVVAAHKDVAIDGPAGVELGGSNVVKGRDDARAVAEQPLRALGGGPIGWKLDHGDLRGNEGNHGIHDDLAAHGRLDLVQDGFMVRIGNRDDDNVGRPRGPEIVVTG